MSTPEFGFVGWNTEGTSDKVWGFFFRPTPKIDEIQDHYRWNRNWNRNVVVFWGRRGGTAMQFKAGVYGDDLETLMRSKLKKGYTKIDQPKLMNIWPCFIAEAEAKLMWAVLAGTVK